MGKRSIVASILLGLTLMGCQTIPTDAIDIYGKDGNITKKQLKEGMIADIKKDVYKDIDTFFQIYDKDGDGIVSEEEVKLFEAELHRVATAATGAAR